MYYCLFLRRLRWQTILSQLLLTFRAGQLRDQDIEGRPGVLLLDRREGVRPQTLVVLKRRERTVCGLRARRMSVTA